MKPAPFDYAQPGSLDEALGLLAVREDAKAIAGGQGLIPLLALRMAAPGLLVDISRIDELRGIRYDKSGIRIGALTRWVIASVRGVRTLPARDFFVGALMTALEPDELLVAFTLSSRPRNRRFAFTEFARRSGDFALAGCCIFWDDENGICIHPRLGVFGVADTAIRVAEVESFLANKSIDPTAARAAGLARSAVAAQTDLHATGSYRSGLLAVLLERAIVSASTSVGSLA
jgi:aerobic carbon-monoxide dehydrogenase medium subunit